MRNATAQTVLSVLVILLIASAIGWAGSQGGHRVGGLPVFALCGVLCFSINWLVFIHAYTAQTELYFDLTGSLTYLTAVACGVALGNRDPRALLLALLVGVWALRLGSFLFLRIRREGVDRRFDALKPDFGRFLLTWTLQGLWVFLTLASALAAITAADAQPVGVLAALGTSVWIAGFAIEAIADRQKGVFRADPNNRDRFISTGLWAWSRHPNYCGEILLWIGIALIALPALSGWSLLTLISPVFVYVLLTRVSGIPLLESRSDAKWGDSPEYQAYKARTPVLWLRPPSAARAKGPR
jgi:steroid 5-alpha reductase family enzyme